MCVSVSAGALEFLHLCVQETGWGGQSLWRRDGLPLSGTLSLCPSGASEHVGRALAGQVVGHSQTAAVGQPRRLLRCTI